MKVEIQIKNLQNKALINSKYFKKVIIKTLKRIIFRPYPVEISMIAVDNRQIKAINRKFRNTNRATDVIAFPSGPEFSAVSPVPRKTQAAKACMNTGKKSGNKSPKAAGVIPWCRVNGGDIFISVERAGSQARKFEHSWKKEMTILAIHGVLHLFGYDHIKKKDAVIMKSKEEEVLNCLSR